MVDTKGSAVVFMSTNTVPEGVAICSLGAGSPRSALLDVEVFPDDETATFRVVGDAAVSLSGCIAILGGELIVDDDEEDEDEDEDGALADEFSEEEDEEEGEEEEDDDDDDEEEEAVTAAPPAPAPAAAPVSAVEKLKQAKRQREDTAAAAPAAAAPAPAAQPAAKKPKQEAAAEAAASKAPAAAPKAPAAAPPAAAAEDGGLVKLTQDGHVRCRDEIVGMGASPVRGKKVTVSCELRGAVRPVGRCVASCCAAPARLVCARARAGHTARARPPPSQWRKRAPPRHAPRPRATPVACRRWQAVQRHRVRPVRPL